MPVPLTFDATANVEDAVSGFAKLVPSLDDVGTAASATEGKGKGLIGTLAGGVGGVVSFLNPIGLATTALTTLGPALLNAGKAADAENTEIAQLTNTIQNAVPSWDGNTDAINEAISAGQAKAFTDSDLRASLGLLAQDTGDVNEAIRLQGLAMDLAASSGIPLAQATKLLGKADDESYGALAKLGIEIEKGTSREDALAAIHEKTAGAADLFAASAEGAGIRLQSGMGDAMETIGGVVAPLMAQGMSLLADGLVGLGPIIQGAADFFSATLAPAIDLIGGVLQGITDGIGMFSQNLGEGMAPVAAFSQLLTDVFGNALQILGTAFGVPQDAILGLQTVVSAAFGSIGGALGSITSLIPSVVAGFGSGGIGGIGAVLGEALPNVLTALMGIGTGIATQAMDWGLQMIRWVGDAVPGLVAGLAQFGSSLFTWITGTAIPQAAGFLMGLGQKFIDFIVPALPGMMVQLQAWGTGMIDWVLNTGIPQAFNALVTLGTTFVSWIAPQIPGLLQKLGELGASLIGWVTGTATPMIIGKLLEWGTAFVAWLGPNIPPLIAKLGEMLGALAGWLINTALPDLIANLSKWGGEFIAWVQPQIPPLLLKLGELLTQLGTWITTVAAPAAVEKLKDLGAAFVNFISATVLPFIGQKLADFGNAIWNWVTQTAVPAALAKLKEVGDSIINGIVNGLSAGKDSVINFIMGIAQGAVDAIKNFFGIKSPSKLMIDLFGPNGVTGGMAAGLEKGASGVLDTAHDLHTATVAALTGNGAGVSLSAALGGAGGGSGAGMQIAVYVQMPDGSYQETKQIKVISQGLQERADMQTGSYA